MLRVEEVHMPGTRMVTGQAVNLRHANQVSEVLQEG